MEKLELIHTVSLIPAKLPVFTVAKRLFTSEQCDQLLTFTQTHGRFYHNGGRRDSREVDIFYLYPDALKWPFDKIGQAALKQNVWNFAISGFAHPIRIQKYKRGGFTEQHADFEYETADPSKITAVIPLVRRQAWAGGQIKLGNHAISPRFDLGDCLFFPSFYSHWVTRVTRGTRITLSAWLAGPAFI